MRICLFIVLSLLATHANIADPKKPRNDSETEVVARGKGRDPKSSIVNGKQNAILQILEWDLGQYTFDTYKQKITTFVAQNWAKYISGDIKIVKRSRSRIYVKAKVKEKQLMKDLENAFPEIFQIPELQLIFNFQSDSLKKVLAQDYKVFLNSIGSIKKYIKVSSKKSLGQAKHVTLLINAHRQKEEMVITIEGLFRGTRAIFSAKYVRPQSEKMAIFAQYIAKKTAKILRKKRGRYNFRFYDLYFLGIPKTGECQQNIDDTLIDLYDSKKFYFKLIPNCGIKWAKDMMRTVKWRHPQQKLEILSSLVKKACQQNGCILKVEKQKANKIIFRVTDCLGEND